MPTLTDEINRSISSVFRRAQIRRRLSATGLYESSWTDISIYIKSWGSLHAGVDDVRLNRFIHSGIRLVVRNDTGAFNPESNVASLWNGTLSRYRTLVRIQAGYTQDDGTELPTDTTQGIYILDGEIPISGVTNDVILNCKSLVSVFEEVRARDIPGLGTAQTATSLFTRIRDHTDGAANFIFREFITSTSWSIQTTTALLNLATTTSIEAMSVWDLMQSVAEVEGYVVFIDRTGSLIFKDRTSNTTTSQFAFLGQGFNPQNIISLDEHKQALDKYYNYFRLKFLEAETLTSYVSAGTTTTTNISNTSWLFGSRVYNFENQFFSTTVAAQTAVDGLLTTFGTVQDEAYFTAKFIPHIDIFDRVTFSYRSYDMINSELWDGFEWASDTAALANDGGNWARDGDNFDINSTTFNIISRETDLDNFTTKFTIRSI